MNENVGRVARNRWTPEERLDALPARIQRAVRRMAEARRMEAQTMVDLNRVAAVMGGPASPQNAMPWQGGEA